MSATHEEAADMIRAFASAHVPLFVSFYRRCLPRFEFVKDQLDEGAIGEVRHVHWNLTRAPTPADVAGEFNWRLMEDEAPGGYFEDLACHGLDLFDFLFGPIEEAHGTACNQQGYYKVPDAVGASWTHTNGATGTGSWIFGAASAIDQVRIIGSAGEMNFAIFEDDAVTISTASGTRSERIDNPDPIQLFHVQRMVDHLAGRAQHPSSGESAARTTLVVDQILGRSSSLGRRPGAGRLT